MYVNDNLRSIKVSQLYLADYIRDEEIRVVSKMLMVYDIRVYIVTTQYSINPLNSSWLNVICWS